LAKKYDEVPPGNPHVNTSAGLQEVFIVLDHNQMHVVQEPCQENAFYYYYLQNMKSFESPIYDEYHDLADNLH
jgi:hypothetical protein